VAEVPEEALTSLVDGLEHARLTARERRMLRLAAGPLRECLGAVADREAPLSLCIALSEAETTRPIDRSAFLHALASQTHGVFDPTRSDASHTGRAGGLIAIGQAVQTILNGMASLVIAGGVDTQCDPYVLASLDRDERIKSAANWDGYIPGEAAAFLLLASARHAAERGLRPLARVTPVATGFEVGHLYSSEPYRGEGLAGTFAQLVARGTIDAPFAEVYSSMTGESHWAKEFGIALLRTKSAFRDSYGMHHQADCCGDTGAACGPLLVALAAHGIHGGYRQSPALAYASSDRGARAAVIVHS